MRLKNRSFLRGAWTNRIPLLLLTVAVLQVLDWHSTLVGVARRGEANRLLNWMSSDIGLPFALAVVKAAFVVVLYGGYVFWRRNKGTYEPEFTACLGMLTVVYAMVVVRNYS